MYNVTNVQYLFHYAFRLILLQSFVPECNMIPFAFHHAAGLTKSAISLLVAPE